MICIGCHVGGRTLALLQGIEPKLLFAYILLKV